MTSAPWAESTLPVGSSARMIVGSPTERPGDGDSLAFASGQLARPVRHAMGKPDPLEGLSRRAPALSERDASVEQAAGHVVEGGECRDQEELLEHEADVVGAHRRQLLVPEFFDR